MLSESPEWKYLARIHSALVAAGAAVKQFPPSTSSVRNSGACDVSTQADRKVSDESFPPRSIHGSGSVHRPD
jgi:hypothetical protein